MTGLYVHIPFCKSKCRYCDFNSFAGCEGYIAPYFSALISEAESWSKSETDFVFDTLYMGGGTPSYVNPQLLGETILKLRSIFDFAKKPEITIECNPKTIDLEGLKILKTSGANRLSIGLQSAKNDTLKVLGRIHTFEDFEKCYNDARQAGFDNISIDLMYGLPDMTMSDWDYSLQKAIDFKPEHISTYALKIEDGTPFSKMNLNLPDDDLCADMYERSVKVLEEYGFKRYEISNFAKEGRESQHNLKYWRRKDYLGLGLGAYSCIKNKRFSNLNRLDEYIKSVRQTGFAVESSEEVLLIEQMSEFVFLGLRCTNGICLPEFKEQFNCDITDVFGKSIKKYCDWGFMEMKNDRLYFTEKGYFVSNSILSDFV